MIVAFDEVDQDSRRACFILFIVEISLLSLSMLPMILFNFLIVDRRIFHVNVICLLASVLFLYYVQWTVRITLLILTFTRTIDGKCRVHTAYELPARIQQRSLNVAMQQRDVMDDTKNNCMTILIQTPLRLDRIVGCMMRMNVLCWLLC